MIEILIVVFLILMNAMFVASEFAVVSAPRMAIEGLAQSGSARARQVMTILKEPIKQDRYIATSQVGITVASLGLGMYGEQVLAHWLETLFGTLDFAHVVGIHAIASAVALLLLTYFHIVLGEMVPKSLALQRSESLILWLVVPMTFFMRLFWPIIIALNGASNFLLKTFLGIDRTQSSIAAFTPEEIGFIVKESETEGILSDEMSTVIKELFDFGDRIVEEIMVPRVHMVALPMRPTAAQIRQVLTNSLHTRYPVYQTDKDHIVGAVHIKDLGAIIDSEGICSLPLRPVPFLPASAPIQTVLDAMKEFRTHIAIVLDEHGGTAGFLTIRDIFEEVLGEFDASFSSSSIDDMEDGSVSVKGIVRLDEIAEHLGIVLQHEEVTS
ncbi:MAG: hemolysin family protein, partial [Candidatus Obscuribacterales bacterium]|nr:hemolysin family protein [Candidatus Obscuribacterales bacterium]